MAEKITDVVLAEATRERYLNYALSVITSRALPDVRDGLKPVQRRILYSMYEHLRLTPDAKHKKSAAVVGEVMAKHHPHGDQSIYDALARLAQDFSMRYPLVDGQGNFGSMDGDAPAAMRYTEARLQHLAVELLSELEKDTVPMVPTYDGERDEPMVLPAQVPNLLVNGVTGIAVGMATNIPPHNLKEVLGAVVALIDDPDLPIERLVAKHIKAPDFPTGGEILNSRDELIEIYRTGHGAVDYRGEYRVEDEPRRRQIVITSVPYSLNKSTLVSEIADHIRTGRLPQLVDVRDESTEEVRVVLELKRDASAEAVMAYLYKRTDLQTRFSVNMTALVPTEAGGVCTPQRLDLKQILEYFRDFRFEVTCRRLEYDLAQLRRRIHILEAFAKIFDALDEAIRLIRQSRNKADARDKLMKRFELDWDQAEAILETKLYRLARLEIDEIRAELAEKRAAAERIEETLASEAKMWELIRGELQDLAKAYGDKRRTRVTGPVEEVAFNEEQYIVAEDSIVLVTRDGWFKRQKSYTELSAVRVREGDSVGWAIPASSRETVILFSDAGRAYTLRVADVPQTTGYGEAIQTRFSLADGEHIVGVATTDPRSLPVVPDALRAQLAEGEPTPPYAVAMTRGGKCVRISLDAFREPSTVNGRLFMRTDPAFANDKVTEVHLSAGTEVACLVSRKGRALLFPVGEINVVAGAGKGVLATKLDEGDFVLGFALLSPDGEGIEVETNKGRIEPVRTRKFPTSSRAGKGREVIRSGYLARIVPRTVEIRWRVEAEPAAEPVAEPAGRAGATTGPSAEEAPRTRSRKASQGKLFDT